MKKILFLIFFVITTINTGSQVSSLKNLSARAVVKALEQYDDATVRPLLRGYQIKKGGIRAPISKTNFEPENLIYIATLPMDIIIPLTIQLALESEKYTIKDKVSFIKATTEHDGIMPIDISNLVELLKVMEKITEKNVKCKGIDLPCFGTKGNSLLHLFVDHKKDPTLFEWVMQYLPYPNQINFNAENFDGVTPLHRAATKRNIVWIEFLIGHGASITKQNIDEKTPLLSYLSSSPQTKPYKEEKLEMSMFPKKRAFKEAKTIQETERISAIIRQGGIPIDHAIVTFLAGQNAEAINIQNRVGRTSLHYVAQYGTPDDVSLLIKLGANVDSYDYQGITPLHVAAKAGRAENVRRLIVEGHANIRLTDERGQNARDKVDQIIGQIISSGDQNVIAHYRSILHSLERLLEQEQVIHPNYYWIYPETYMKEK